MAAARRVGVLLGLVATLPLVAGLGVAFCMTKMPGKSHQGPLPPMTAQWRQLAAELERHVVELADKIGQRHALAAPEGLLAARKYIESQLGKHAGLAVALEDVGPAGKHARNVTVEIPASQPKMKNAIGAEAPVIVVGAHYDTNPGTPGANDNGSGVAAALVLAHAFAKEPARTNMRFVFFANEEVPFFQGPGMGSLVHARRAKAHGDDVVAMLSLETLGYYSDVSGSQRYPAPLDKVYPPVGNFIAFVGNVASANLTRTLVESFRRHAAFPSQGGALPDSLPGVGWSDHWAFWQVGYPAVMVTDTALFRDPNYHGAGDLPSNLNYAKLARVVAGLEAVLRELADVGLAKR